jgi:hypothetical protein
MGSTSYDETREASETTWGGASWYGTTSGEYWTINPREYADPRKHGPEYQSRARRATTTDGWEAPLDDAAEAFAAPAGPEADVQPGIDADAPRTASSGARESRTWTPPPEPDHGAAGASGSRDVDDVDIGDVATTRAGPSRGPRVDALLTPDVDPIRRLGFALIAWAPLGVASASAIGDATGCSSYSAACGGSAPLLPWLAQAVILGILLLTPAVSRILAVGTLAVLVALVPLTGVLVAFGGASQRESSGVLGVLLAVAWLIGVGLAVRVGRARTLDARARTGGQ